MTSIKVDALRVGLTFGARVAGINRRNLKDEAIREQIRDIFEDRGVIVFEDMEPSSEMRLADEGPVTDP